MILYILYSIEKIRELNKIIATTDIQIYIVIASKNPNNLIK